MTKYELLVVVPGTVSDQEAGQKVAAVEQLVTAHGNHVETHTLGKNRLAYPVRQIRYGYFYTVIFEAEPPALAALTGKLRLERDLLRALVSRFNTNLTAAQKIVYTTDDSGVTTMRPRSDEAASARPAPAPASALAELLAEAPAPRAASSAVERPVERVNLEEINKKLDDIMKGEILPGV